MSSGTWFNRFASDATVQGLQAETREELARLDDRLYKLWNLGGNALLAWTWVADDILVLSVRHYAIAESVHAAGPEGDSKREAAAVVHDLLSGPKRRPPDEFRRFCDIFNCEPEVVRTSLHPEYESVAAAISEIVRCYGVTLVRNRAVMLLDIVGFSLRPPLDQMAMLNSLAYSVNSAYGQLLSKDIRINFARTTTGDGFYIWNRATTAEADTELFKLLMMILADNAVAQRKARGSWVPRLRAAFHVGEHYEFQQVEGLNPTTFSYIVGQVTVDLARILERALPGQILLGDFVLRLGGGFAGRGMRLDTPDFVESTAVTLEQLNGLDISGGRVKNIRCYLTGRTLGGGRYVVNRYHVRDKHGESRRVYNGKMNIHLDKSEPVFLGMRSEDLSGFEAVEVESLNRDAEETGSFIVRP
jgi:hypothetical protein